MQLRQEFIVGKVEEGFDFKSTATNIKLKIQSPVLTRYNSRQLLGELIRLGYSSGQYIKFARVSKRTTVQDVAEITFVSEDTRQRLLQQLVF